MNQQETGRENSTGAEREPNVLPATEIAKNPNPRANANISDKIEDSSTEEKSSGAGSEITDGEDA